MPLTSIWPVLATNPCPYDPKDTPALCYGIPEEARHGGLISMSPPFEHAARLKELLARQAQLKAALDRDKSDAQAAEP